MSEANPCKDLTVLTANRGSSTVDGGEIASLNQAGNAKGGSITVPLTSFFTGLD